MRTIPGLVVMCPADDIEAKEMVRAAYAYKGPVYMRFSRAASPVFHDENHVFEIGKGEVLKEGKDAAVIANGILVPEALKAAEMLEAEGIHIRVINISTIKPLDEEIILQAAGECPFLVTAEEHTIIGGLGEAVCSLVSEKHPVPVYRIGIRDEFGHSGPAKELLEEFGLTAPHIAEEVRKHR
jgi:transketolase